MFRSTLSARKQLAARRAQKQRPARPIFEQLEKRELFVVGANFFPVEDLSFDGVVQILNVGVPGGSGVLLESGRHILTAAHCLDLQLDTDGNGQVDTGDRVVDGNFTVRFEVDGREFDYNVPSTSVSFPPSYTGSWFNSDLALITLPDAAPLGADRSGLYRFSDEVGQSFTAVGYGATGSGTAVPGGALPGTPAGHDNSFNTKRSGANSYDSVTGTVLNYDLDNVNGEVLTAPGDSGGPNFIGGRVAGITSGGTLLSRFNNVGGLNYPSGSALNTTAIATRVSSFLNWIDNAVAGTYDLVIDMNHQPGGGDGAQDTIQVQRTWGAIEVYVNGRLCHWDNAGNVRSLTIRGSSDNDVIDVDTQFPITIDGRTGQNTLVAPDLVNGWKITGANRGAIGEWATFSNVGNIKGGSNTDAFTFESAGRISGAVNGGGGIDVLDYQRWTSAVDVNLLAGRATGAGGVGGIENVKGGSGNDILVGDANVNNLSGNGGHDVLDGGDGADELFGGVGNDVLVGGRGADRLEGQADDDILIGGQYTRDASLVRREWIRTDIGYNARVNNLRLGGGLNGISALNSTTTPDDGSADSLYGGTGTSTGVGSGDWFWGAASEAKDREYDFTRSRFELLN